MTKTEEMKYSLVTQKDHLFEKLHKTELKHHPPPLNNKKDKLFKQRSKMNI